MTIVVGRYSSPGLLGIGRAPRGLTQVPPLALRPFLDPRDDCSTFPAEALASTWCCVFRVLSVNITRILSFGTVFINYDKIMCIGLNG